MNEKNNLTFFGVGSMQKINLSSSLLRKKYFAAWFRYFIYKFYDHEQRVVLNREL